MTTAAKKMTAPHPDACACGGRLVTADGRTLPLRGAVLHAEARAGLARVRLEQRFANAYGEPLAVTYLMPLPADGAVSGYEFRIGERRIVGEVDRLESARERYEEAIASGRSAALVEQERSSLFTQQIGNIPPGAEVVATLTIDQKLQWLDEGAWEWRFPTVAMPRYQGAAGRVADAERISPDVADAPLPAQLKLSLAIGDRLAASRRPESPTQGLLERGDGTVELAADGGARLDRDLVVRWAVAAAAPGLQLDVGRPSDGKPHASRAYGVLTLVPPSPAERTARVPRDLCLLVDTSGSMSGEPLAQARRVLGALVDTLGAEDSLEMIEFSNQARRWKRTAVGATDEVRAEARRWLSALEAGGGTEMRSGLMEALAPLRAEAQRQIVLVSDGAIGFEREIVADILAQLPAGSRLHTVGVGSAVNRSLTQPAARAGRGVEVIIGLGEDPERAAQRICARTAAPLVVEVRLEGSALLEHAPRRLPDLFAAAPVSCAVALKPEGGELVARGRMRSGEWVARLTVAPIACGEGSAAAVGLFGREAVEDLEMRLCAGEPAEEINRAIERLGLEFQISTRLTSWVAIADSPSVDPTKPMRRERIPQELPYGASVEGLGLRGPTLHAAAAGGMMRARSAAVFAGAAAAPMAASGMTPPKASGGVMGALGRVFQKARAEDRGFSAEEYSRDTTRRLRGRILRIKNRELIVQVDIGTDFDWTLPTEAWVQDEHGALVHALVDARRSTAGQRLTQGQSLRLVLILDDELGSAARLIEGDGFAIEV
jgi:Ca-activated chloride channel family protein